MTYLSIQTASILAITRNVNSALLTHIDQVVAAATAVLFPRGVPAGVDMRALCVAITDLLQRVVASMVEGLLRLAGLDHLADRARPTSRRRAGLTEPEDGLEPQPPSVELPGEQPPATPEPV